MDNIEATYDQVAVQVTDGGYNMLSIEEWKQIDITKRIELMKSGKVTFLLEGKVASV